MVTRCAPRASEDHGHLSFRLCVLCLKDSPEGFQLRHHDHQLITVHRDQKVCIGSFYFHAKLLCCYRVSRRCKVRNAHRGGRHLSAPCCRRVCH